MIPKDREHTCNVQTGHDNNSPSWQPVKHRWKLEKSQFNYTVRSIPTKVRTMYLGPAFAICSADPSGHETLSAVSFLSFLFFFFSYQEKDWWHRRTEGTSQSGHCEAQTCRFDGGRDSIWVSRMLEWLYRYQIEYYHNNMAHQDIQ